MTSIAALEIGSSKIRAALGQVDPGAPVTVLAVEEESLPTDIVRYGVVRNVEKVAQTVDRLLQRLAARVAPRGIQAIYVAIGGRSVSSSERSVERQLPEEMEITTRLLNELKLEALSLGANALPGVDDVIEALPRSFTIDGQTSTQPEGEVGNDVMASYVLISAQDKLRNNLERVVEKLRIDLAGVILRPLAVADFVLSPDEKSLGCMFVDFGAETTTVAIYRHSALQFLNTLPIGSRNITRDIMTLHYLEEQAESLKRNGGHAAPKPGETIVASGVDFKDINNYVAARASEIIYNIRNQLSAAGITAQELPAGIIITGGGAKLRGFNDRLAEVTKMKVRAAIPASTTLIRDSSISPGEQIDIIAVLTRAAADPRLVECLSPMPVVEPVEDPLEVIEETAPQPATQDREEKKKKKGQGFFSKIANKVVKFAQGPNDDFYGDDNDDDDLRDD